MARTLKPICPETPILYGEDARRFLARMKNPPKASEEKLKEFKKWCETFKQTYTES